MAVLIGIIIVSLALGHEVSQFAGWAFLGGGLIVGGILGFFE